MRQKTTVRYLRDHGLVKNEYQYGALYRRKTVRAASEAPYEASVTVGENLPNWRELIRTGGNATTYLSGNDWTIRKNVIGNVRYRDPTNSSPTADAWLEYIGSIYSPMALTVPGWLNNGSREAATGEATREFVSRALEKLNKLNGLQALGEASQVIKLFLNPVNGSVRLFQRILKRGANLETVKGRSVATREVAKAMGNLHLELAFGWKPLLSDLDGAAQALARLNWGGESFGMAKGSSMVYSESSWGTDYVDPCFRVKVSYRSEFKATLRGVVFLPSQGDLGGFFSDSLGLSNYNIARTAWELIPFSFLADYFLSIGSSLEALTLLHSGKLRWHSITLRDAAIIDKTETPWTPSPTYQEVSGTASQLLFEKSTVSRTPQPPPLNLVTRPVVKPMEDNLLHLQRATNMAALLVRQLDHMFSKYEKQASYQEQLRRVIR